MTFAGPGEEAVPVDGAPVDRIEDGAAAAHARDIIARLLYAKASGLAREGRYSEAEGLLDRLTPDALSLDLLARIRAQQGRFRDAETLWRRALELDPGNEACIAALRRISTLGMSGYFPYFFTAVLVALAVLLTVITVSIYWKRQLSSAVSAPAVSDRPVQSVPHIDMPGVIVRQEKDHALLTFSPELFNPKERLTPEAKSLLTRLAKQLEPVAGGISVRISGVYVNHAASDRGGDPDRAALAMARAFMVAEHMTATSSLPPEVFIVSGRPDTVNKASSEHGMAGRTVVIRLSGVK